jgi:hypothetical protein
MTVSLYLNNVDELLILQVKNVLVIVLLYSKLMCTERGDWSLVTKYRGLAYNR